MRRTRRNPAAGFKANVALAALQGDKTLVGLHRRSMCRPTRLWNGSHKWWIVRQRYLAGDLPASHPPNRTINVLHAKMGQLTLENNFLEGTLTKAGWLSARR